MFELTLNSGIQLTIASILFGVAMMRGGAPERILAGTLLIRAALAVTVVQYLGASSVAWPGWTIMTIAALVFCILCTVAVRANRVYPVWLGSAQIVKLISHMWRLSLAKPALAAHLILDEAAFYLQFAVMGVGLASHIARSRRLQQGYPDWTPR